jgi:hypothetical protein
MSTSASRQFRSARNMLAEALGLGEAYPLRDLPVIADPAIVPFGGTAAITITDSERKVAYRLLDQTGQPLPGRGGPKGTGSGEKLSITSPEVAEDVSYMIGAARPNGRMAALFEVAAIKVGLDASLPVGVDPPSAAAIVIDRGAPITVTVEHSQEAVTYSLIARPVPDNARSDDVAAAASDIKLSDAAGVGGTGGTIKITSVALTDDVVIRVRAVKTFGGRNPRPPQTVLLTQTLPVFVRTDADLAVAANPAIVDYGGQASVVITKAVAGVSYRLYARLIPDADFSRKEPPDPATLAVPTPDGDVRMVLPEPTAAWKKPAGFAPLGQAVAGAGAALTLPAGTFARDTLLIVEARKSHGSGGDGFTSAERLTNMAAVLTRPATKPGLRLEALIGDGKLVELRGLEGEPGVFYAIKAPAALGELYFHQIDPVDVALNKGIGALAIAVDMVPAYASAGADTSRAPPPLPRLSVASLALPVTLKLTARRAMTRLTADLSAIAVPAMPAVQLPAAPVAAGSSAKVVITQPVAGERYRLLVGGKPVADPVTAAAAAISLETGALTAGATVELWAASGDAGAGITVERRMPLAIGVG